MTVLRIFAVVLVLAGIAGFVFGSVSYTEEKTAFKAGPLELKVQDEQTVAIPAWASGGAIVVGVVLLLVGGRKR